MSDFLIVTREFHFLCPLTEFNVSSPKSCSSFPKWFVELKKNNQKKGSLNSV